jgi:hypothetical protein
MPDPADHYWNGSKHAFTVNRDGSFSWNTSDEGFWHFGTGDEMTSDFELNMKGSGTVQGQSLKLKLEFEEVSGKMVGRAGGRITHTQTLSRGDAQRTYWSWVNKDVQKTGQLPKSRIGPVDVDFLKPTSVVTEGDDVVVTYRTHNGFTVGAGNVQIEVVHRAKAADLLVLTMADYGVVADGAIFEMEVWASNNGPADCPICNVKVDFRRDLDVNFGRAEFVSANTSNGDFDAIDGDWVLKDGLPKSGVPSNLILKWKIRLDPNTTQDPTIREAVSNILRHPDDGVRRNGLQAGYFSATIQSGMYDPKLSNNRARDFYVDARPH